MEATKRTSYALFRRLRSEKYYKRALRVIFLSFFIFKEIFIHKRTKRLVLMPFLYLCESEEEAF
jgi:hypothetical protein